MHGHGDSKTLMEVVESRRGLIDFQKNSVFELFSVQYFNPGGQNSNPLDQPPNPHCAHVRNYINSMLFTEIQQRISQLLSSHWTPFRPFLIYSFFLNSYTFTSQIYSIAQGLSLYIGMRGWKCPKYILTGGPRNSNRFWQGGSGCIAFAFCLGVRAGLLPSSPSGVPPCIYMSPSYSSTHFTPFSLTPTLHSPISTSS